MARKPHRVALMLDLEWPCKRHTSTFAGTQRYVEEHGWHSIVDEFAHDTLPARRTRSNLYDGTCRRICRHHRLRNGMRTNGQDAFGDCVGELGRPAWASGAILHGYLHTAAGLVNLLEEKQQNYQLDRFLNQLDRTDLLICDELGYCRASRIYGTMANR